MICGASDVFGRFEIEACLNVHPERSAGLEEFAEPQRGVGRNGLFFARDAFDPGARHVQRGRDRVRCQLKRNEKFFPQDFAGMNRRKFLCHVRTPIRWPHSAGLASDSRLSPRLRDRRIARPWYLDEIPSVSAALRCVSALRLIVGIQPGQRPEVRMRPRAEQYHGPRPRPCRVSRFCNTLVPR